MLSDELAARAGAKLAAAGRGALGRADLFAAVGCSSARSAIWARTIQCGSRRMCDLAEALSRRGELERAEAVLTSAMETARRVGNESLGARARLLFNSLRTRVDPSASVEDELEHALEIAASLEGTGDLSTLARAYAEIGMSRFMLGRAGEGDADLERAADVAQRAGDRVSERAALNSRLRPIAWGPTPAGEGIAFCMQLLESEAANAGDRAHALQVRALFHAMQGDFDDARSAASQAWALIEEYGLELLKGTHSLDVGVAEVIAGDLDAAAARLRRGHELLVEMGDTGVRSTVDAILADVEFRLGRIGRGGVARGAEPARSLPSTISTPSRAGAARWPSSSRAGASSTTRSGSRARPWRSLSRPTSSR